MEMCDGKYMFGDKSTFGQNMPKKCHTKGH